MKYKTNNHFEKQFLAGKFNHGIYKANNINNINGYDFTIKRIRRIGIKKQNIKLFKFSLKDFNGDMLQLKNEIVCFMNLNRLIKEYPRSIIAK